MKKILILFVLAVLIASFVGAEGADNKPEMDSNGTAKAVPTLISANPNTGNGSDNKNGSNIGNGTLDREQIREEVKDKLQNGSALGLMLKGEGAAKLQTGLENAIMQVKNEQAKLVLERNMNAFAEKYQNRIANMTGVELEVDEETGATTIKAKEQSRFLGIFKTEKSKTFEIAEDGKMKEKKGLFGFLYSNPKSE